MVPSKTYRKDPSAFSTRTSPFDVDGNEMLALLDKALYRHPIASLRRSQTRDAFTLMKFFDERGWGCICIIVVKVKIYNNSATIEPPFRIQLEFDDFRPGTCFVDI